MKLAPLSEYMEQVREIKTNYWTKDRLGHVNLIILSTEDPQVIEETKNYPDFRFVYTEYDRPKGSHTPMALARMHKPSTEAKHAFLNLYLSFHCNAFVQTVRASPVLFCHC